MLRCIPWKHRVSYVRPNTCCLVTDSLKGSVRGSGAQNPHTGYSTNPGRPEPWNEALFLETPIGLYISVSAFSYECVRNGNPLQYSFLENPMDRGAWQTTEHGVAKSWTWQSNWVHTHIYTHTPCKKLLFLLDYSTDAHIVSSWITALMRVCTHTQHPPQETPFLTGLQHWCACAHTHSTPHKKPLFLLDYSTDAVVFICSLSTTSSQALT